jgi:hypothetical protein
MNPEIVACIGAQPVLDIVWNSMLNVRSQSAEHAILVIGMESDGPLLERLERLWLRQAEQFPDPQ